MWRPSSLVTDYGALDMWQICHQNACPKDCCDGNRRTGKDPEADLASLGLIVSKKTSTMLPNVTPMSKI